MIQKRHFFSCALMLCLFFGVLSGDPALAQERNLRVMVSTYPLWIFTRNVTAGVPGVDVGLTLPAGTGCPHDYALTPQDIQRLHDADLLVVNGKGLDSFMLAALKNLGRDIPVIDSSEEVSSFLEAEEEGVEAHLEEHGEEAEEGHHHHDEEENPHAYVSPSRAADIARAIASGLGRADPDHEEAYSANAEAYAETLEALSAEIGEWGAQIENNKIIVQHSALAYLADEADLDLVAVIQEHEGQEPSAARLLRIGELIRLAAEDEEPVALILTEPQYPDRAGQTLAREYKIPVIRIDSVSSGPENPPLEYYQQVMARNLALLRNSLR